MSPCDSISESPTIGHLTTGYELLQRRSGSPHSRYIIYLCTEVVKGVAEITPRACPTLKDHHTAGAAADTVSSCTRHL